jgi:hypothetical protein
MPRLFDGTEASASPWGTAEGFDRRRRSGERHDDVRLG